MKLVMDVLIQGDTALVAAVAFDDWNAMEGTKNYSLRIERVEKPAKGELDLRELPWLVQLLDANGLQPEAIVMDGFVHLDAQETPGLGRRLHDTLGGRTAVIGVSKSLFKGSETPDQFCVFREDETPPLVVTLRGHRPRCREGARAHDARSQAHPHADEAGGAHRQGERGRMTGRAGPGPRSARD